jgi:integron integrase
MYRYNKTEKVAAQPLASKRLMDQVCERIRYLHYSLKTEKAYLYWVRFFILWTAKQGGMRHPKEMGGPEVEAFLTMLATERQVSPSTHRQALNALLFLYREVLSMDLPWMQQIGRPPERRRIPVVLTVAEVQLVLVLMQGVEGVIARLLYGTGMRLSEGLSLRVKDVDFDRHVVVVRSSKGDKDRVVMLPRSLESAMRDQLASSRAQWAADRAAERSGVYMPHALDAKYPRAGLSWAWHWAFPAPKLSIDPRTGVERRHHLYEERLSRQLKLAAGGTASPLDALQAYA